MKTKLRVTPLCFAVLCCIALASCGKGESASSTAAGGAARSGDKINVTTSIFAPYDFVREIAGDRVNLSMLLPPGAESHSFEPTPRDIITIEQSDVFVFTGGESDAWLDRILGSMDTEGMKILSMMDAATVVPEELVEGMEDDDAHDRAEAHNEEANHDHEEAIVYDEHVWTAPENAVLIVRAITEALCGADPVNAAYYRENSRAYTESLAQLDAGFKAAAEGAAQNTIVFGDRFPFRYLADAYGLEYYAAFPGCAAETEPSAATVAFLINKIKAEQIPVVFHIELSNERMADIIAAETGAKKLLLHACHTISKSDFDAGKSYLSLMESNVGNLREALR